MDNTIQLYVDKKQEVKGYPITSPDRVIDENGTNIKDYVDEAIDNAKLEGGNTQVDLSDYAKKTDLHSHSNKTILDNITTSKVNQWDSKSDFSGDYNDLTNKPTIPSLNGYATEQYVNEEIEKIDVTEQLTDYAKKSELHSHSNKNVLDGITTNKITEWDNKSTFDGNYNSLANKPTIPTKTSQLSNDSGFITTVPSEYINETELQVHTDQVLSAGEQLVLNGSQMLQNNYNFSQLTYDGSQANNSGGSLLGGVGKRQDITSDYFFAINPNKPLYASFDVKGAVGSSMYAFVDFYDVDKKRISANAVMYQPNTLTRLTQDLKNGDTVVHLEDLTNWKETLTATHEKSFIFWNYTNKQGYTYPPETYSRNMFKNVYTDSSSVDKVNKTITLTTAWNKGTIPTGTYVSQGDDGSNYRYIKGTRLEVTTEWKTISGIYEGMDYTGSNIQSKLPPGTAFAKFAMLLNYTGVADEKVWITNIVVKEDVYSAVEKKADKTYVDTELAKKTDLHSHSNKTILDSITTSKVNQWDSKSDFSGNYNDLTNKPTIPTKTSQLTNNSGFLTSIPSEYVTETELNTAFEQFNPNSLQQIPLYANSIEECTDTTKCYVLPDGFIYAYKETTVEIEPPDPEDPNEPLYTNVFEVDGYNLNKRWSYSGKKYSDQNGHVVSGYIPVKVGDVVRIKCKNLTLGSLNYDYNRVHFFDSSNNYVNGHYDGAFNLLLKLTSEGDNTYSFVVGYECKTANDDSTNYLIEGANDIAKMLIVFNIGHVAFNNETKLLTDEDYINANIIVTVNQEIKEPVVVQPNKNLVDTAKYYLNARYNSSNTLKQTDAETGYVAFDYIDIKKGDILRFKSTTRGYHKVLGGSLLLWGNYPRLRFFNANNQLVASGPIDASPIKNYFKLVDEGDNTTAIYVGYKADGTLYDDADQIAKTRFTIQPNDPLVTLTEADMQNVKITINTPMSELDNVLPPEGNTQVVWKWSNTGHAFVPNENYDNLIADMKNITDEHSKDIVYLKAIVNSEDSTSGLSDSQKIARIKNWDMPIYENAPVFLLEENKPGWTTSNLTNDKLIEMYDTLMNNNSHYITKEDLGMASDGTTHLYAYHFREPEPHREGNKGSEKKPVILICSGIHPTERAGEWSMYYALEEITNNPDLDDLRRNIHFIIMPLINPTAVNDSTWGVRNPDGIQTHYQFEVDFNKGNASPGERNYGGEEPLTIPESIAFDNLMKTYKDDLAIVMSCHNNDVDTKRGTDFIWCSCPTNFATNLGYRLADKMSKAWHKKHGTTFEEGVIWANQYALQKASEGSSLFNPSYVKERPSWDWRVGQAGLSGSGGTEYKQALKYGVQGINVEVCSRNMVMDKSFNMTWSSNVMTWGCEAYVNFFRIFMAVYDYKDKEQYYKK